MSHNILLGIYLSMNGIARLSHKHVSSSTKTCWRKCCYQDLSFLFIIHRGLISWQLCAYNAKVQEKLCSSSTHIRIDSRKILVPKSRKILVPRNPENSCCREIPQKSGSRIFPENLVPEKSRKILFPNVSGKSSFRNFPENLGPEESRKLL